MELSSQFTRQQGKHEPITKEEARGNSRPVSHDEFQQLANKGERQIGRRSMIPSGTRGIDRHWEDLKEHSYGQIQVPWGGSTINARSGKPLRTDANRFAVTVRPPGSHTVSVPPNVSREQFGEAMDRAKEQFSPTLRMRGGHLGVFHDVDEGRVDIDPSIVVRRPKSVESIGSYSHAIGGAYHFKSGNGYFPPHVED